MKNLDQLLEKMVNNLQSSYPLGSESGINLFSEFQESNDSADDAEPEEITITLKGCRINPRTGKKECITRNVFNS